MTTKKEFLTKCFQGGMDIKTALGEARSRFGKCSKRSAEISYREFEKTKLAKPEAKAETKAETPKPEASHTNETAKQSEIISEADEISLDDMSYQEMPESAPTTTPEQTTGPQDAPMGEMPPSEVLPDAKLTRLRKAASRGWTDAHIAGREMLDVPAKPDEIAACQDYGDFLAEYIIQDANQELVIMAACLLTFEGKFWGPAVKEFMKRGEMEAKARKAQSVQTHAGTAG